MRGKYRMGGEEMKERRVEEGGAESTGGASRGSVGITRCVYVLSICGWDTCSFMMQAVGLDGSDWAFVS